MGILPYAPSLTGISRTVAATQTALAFSISGFIKSIMQGTEVAPQLKEREQIITAPKPFTIPKIWQPTLAWEREKFKHLTLETPVEEEKKKLIAVPTLKPLIKPISKHKPLPFEVPISKQRAVPIVVPALKQVTKQLQKLEQQPRLVQPQPTPYPTPLKYGVPPIFRLPRRERRRPRKRKDEDFFDLFGRYKRQYPVMTPKKALKFLLDL